MNGRQRVLAAIEHQEPDGVPVDIGSTPSSGISATAHYNLMQYLGESGTPTRVYDVVQQVAQPDDAFLDRFGIDAIDIGRAFDAPRRGLVRHYPAYRPPSTVPNLVPRYTAA